MLTAEKIPKDPLANLLECYKEYKGVFSQEAASKLPDGRIEHPIDLQEEKMPP